MVIEWKIIRRYIKQNNNKLLSLGKRTLNIKFNL